VTQPPTDLFGNAVEGAAPGGPTPTAKPSAAQTPGKTKLVFGQKPAPAPAPSRGYTPPSPSSSRPSAGSSRTTLPPPLPVPQLIRPAHEHAIDEAQATALLFDRLGRNAQRLLFELQQAHPDYVPVLPSAGEVTLAGELLLSDPAVKLRIALLAGAFRAPATPPALVGMPTPAKPAAAPVQADLAGESPAAPDPATMAPGATEAAQDGPKGGEAVDATPPGLVAKLAKLTEYIVGRTWGPADALARNLPDAIRDHWVAVLTTARTANDVMSHITHANIDRAIRLAEGIDCQPVCEAIVAHATLLRASLPAVVIPPRPSRTARALPSALPPPLPVPPEASELPPPLPLVEMPQAALPDALPPFGQVAAPVASDEPALEVPPALSPPLSRLTAHAAQPAAATPPSRRRRGDV
jgi:hypothetical protein